MPSTNDRAPFLGQGQPTYPPLAHVVRVTGASIGNNVYPAYIQQQNAPALSLRDREQVYVWEPNGVNLPPGYYRARLTANYLGLPLLLTSAACCCSPSPTSATSSGTSSATSGTPTCCTTITTPLCANYTPSGSGTSSATSSGTSGTPTCCVTITTPICATYTPSGSGTSSATSGGSGTSGGGSGQSSATSGASHGSSLVPTPTCCATITTPICATYTPVGGGSSGISSGGSSTVSSGVSKGPGGTCANFVYPDCDDPSDSPLFLTLSSPGTCFDGVSGWLYFDPNSSPPQYNSGVLANCSGNPVTAYLVCTSFPAFWVLHILCGGDDIGAFPDPGTYSCVPFFAHYVGTSVFSPPCCDPQCLVNATITE